MSTLASAEYTMNLSIKIQNENVLIVLLGGEPQQTYLILSRICPYTFTQYRYIVAAMSCRIYCTYIRSHTFYAFDHERRTRGFLYNILESLRWEGRISIYQSLTCFTKFPL